MVNTRSGVMVSIFHPVLRKCLCGNALFHCFKPLLLRKCRAPAAFCSGAPIVGVGELKTVCHRYSRW